jgi:DNA processing protein
MPGLDVEEKMACVRLARSPGIGPRGFQKLLSRLGTARAAVAAMPGLLGTRRWPGVALAGSDVAEREIEAAERVGATILVAPEPGYPASLGAIDDPPPVLVLRGRAELLTGPVVAIVGARNASTNGRKLTRAMAAELSAGGLAIVSGLARGIDAAAHEGALAERGGTIAVVASGIDIAYPEENADLMARIAAEGLVISERPIGAVPRAADFPRRNRIIAGLALGVVVVEAAPRSGSLITARLAAEQGREVMAVPGSPLDERHRGTNRLLRDGAHLVECAADVRAVIDALGGRPGPRREPPAPPASDTPTAQSSGIEASSDLCRTIELGLGPEPVAVDELVRQCHASAAAVQAALSDLEIEGRLERHPGNRVSLRAGP